MKYLAIPVLITLVLAIGTFFYSSVEGWSYLDSLYFSVMTLTTVGYGDLVPSSDLSKMFTVMYVFVGVGIVFGTIMLLGERAHRRVSAFGNHKDEQV